MARFPNELPIESSLGDLTWKGLAALAGSCFVGALFLDVVYARSANFMWVTFSVWLITIGLILAGVALVVAAVVWIVDGRGARRVDGDDRPRRLVVWPYVVGFGATCLVSIFNAFVHSRDAYEAVVPDGLALSIAAVILLLATPVCARALVRATVQPRTRKTLP